MTTTTTTTAPTARSTTLRQLEQSQGSQAALQALEAQVRQQPTDLASRWALAELLCVLGQWPRALKQAQLCAQQDSGYERHAQWLRSLISAEAQREGVFAGKQAPRMHSSAEPQWMQLLWQALAANAALDVSRADQLREQALSHMPEYQGSVRHYRPSSANNQPGAADAPEHWVQHRFEWLADSDSRLGAVCEVVLAGRYTWVDFGSIERIELTAPQHLLELVWRKVRLHLRHGGPTPGQPNTTGAALHAHIPARSCVGDIDRAKLSPALRADMLQARLSDWREVGQTGVFTLGQKTWLCAAHEVALLDVRELHLQPQRQPHEPVQSSTTTSTTSTTTQGQA